MLVFISFDKKLLQNIDNTYYGIEIIVLLLAMWLVVTEHYARMDVR